MDQPRQTEPGAKPQGPTEDEIDLGRGLDDEPLLDEPEAEPEIDEDDS